MEKWVKTVLWIQCNEMEDVANFTNQGMELLAQVMVMSSKNLLITVAKRS